MKWLSHAGVPTMLISVKFLAGKDFPLRSVDCKRTSGSLSGNQLSQKAYRPDETNMLGVGQ